MVKFAIKPKQIISGVMAAAMVMTTVLGSIPLGSGKSSDTKVKAADQTSMGTIGIGKLLSRVDQGQIGVEELGHNGGDTPFRFFYQKDPIDGKSRVFCGYSQGRAHTDDEYTVKRIDVNLLKDKTKTDTAKSVHSTYGYNLKDVAKACKWFATKYPNGSADITVGATVQVYIWAKTQGLSNDNFNNCIDQLKSKKNKKKYKIKPSKVDDYVKAINGTELTGTLEIYTLKDCHGPNDTDGHPHQPYYRWKGALPRWDSTFRKYHEDWEEDSTIEVIKKDADTGNPINNVEVTLESSDGLKFKGKTGWTYDYRQNRNNPQTKETKDGICKILVRRPYSADYTTPTFWYMLNWDELDSDTQKEFSRKGYYANQNMAVAARDQQGNAMFEAIKQSKKDNAFYTWTITEENASKVGYYIIKPNYKTINESEGKRNISTTFKDKPKRIKIHIHKRAFDKEAGKDKGRRPKGCTVAGAQYELTAKSDMFGWKVDEDGELVQDKDSTIKAGEHVATLTIDNDGNAVSPKLPFSAGYYLQETETPYGFALDPTKYEIDPSNAGDKEYLKIYQADHKGDKYNDDSGEFKEEATPIEAIINETDAKGTVHINKKTYYPKTKQKEFEAGVKFQLVGTNPMANGYIYGIDDPETKGEGEGKSIQTTDGIGDVTWTKVPAGTYRIVQLTTTQDTEKLDDRNIIVKKDGQVIDLGGSNSKKADGTPNDPNNLKGDDGTWDNTKMGGIMIYKYMNDPIVDSLGGITDSKTGEIVSTFKPEANATFQIINKATGKVFSTITTNEAGRAFQYDVPAGTYTIHQISGNEYYKYVDDFEVTVKEGETSTASYKFEKKDWIKDNKLVIYKTYQNKDYPSYYSKWREAKVGKPTPEKNAKFYILDCQKLGAEKIEEIKKNEDNWNADKRAKFITENLDAVITNNVDNSKYAKTDINGEAYFQFPLDYVIPKEGFAVFQTEGKDGYYFMKTIFSAEGAMQGDGKTPRTATNKLGKTTNVFTYTPVLKNDKTTTATNLYQVTDTDDQFMYYGLAKAIKTQVKDAEGNTVIEPGATFELYDSDGHKVPKYTYDGKNPVPVTKTVKDENGKDVEVATDDAYYTTDKNGEIYIPFMKMGTYVLNQIGGDKRFYLAQDAKNVSHHNVEEGKTPDPVNVTFNMNPKDGIIPKTVMGAYLDAFNAEASKGIDYTQFSYDDFIRHGNTKGRILEDGTEIDGFFSDNEINTAVNRNLAIMEYKGKTYDRSIVNNERPTILKLRKISTTQGNLLNNAVFTIRKKGKNDKGEEEYQDFATVITGPKETITTQKDLPVNEGDKDGTKTTYNEDGSVTTITTTIDTTKNTKTLVTKTTNDGNGIATVSGMYYGDYEIEETNAAKGYLLREDNHDEHDSTNDDYPKRLIHITINKDNVKAGDHYVYYEPTKDNLTLADGSMIHYVKTDDEGRAHYIYAKDGNLQNTQNGNLQNFTMKDGFMTWRDAPITGHIKVNKTGEVVTGYDSNSLSFDTEEDGQLKGAIFGLYAREDILYEDGTVWKKKGSLIDIEETDKDGQCTFYREPWKAVGTETLDEKDVVNVTTKDSYDTEKYTEENPVLEKLPGQKELTDSFPMGQYYVKELVAPEGYVLDQTEHDICLAYDATAEYLNNLPIPGLDDEPELVPSSHGNYFLEIGPLVKTDVGKILENEQYNEGKVDTIIFTDDSVPSDAVNISSIFSTDGGRVHDNGKTLDVSADRDQTIKMWIGKDPTAGTDSVSSDKKAIYISSCKDDQDVLFNANSSKMFNGFAVIKNIRFHAVDTEYIQDSSKMFRSCRNIEELDLSNWQTPSLTYTKSMFEGCSTVAHIYTGNAEQPYQEPKPKVVGIIASYKGRYAFYHKPKDIDNPTKNDNDYKYSQSDFDYAYVYNNGTAVNLDLPDGAITDISPKYPYALGDEDNKSPGWTEVTLTLSDSERNIKDDDGNTYTIDQKTIDTSVYVMDPSIAETAKTREHQTQIQDVRNSWYNIAIDAMKIDKDILEETGKKEAIGKATLTIYAETDFVDKDGKIVVHGPGKDKNGKPTNGDVVGTITTNSGDEDGFAQLSNLPIFAKDRNPANTPNLYKVVETIAPVGYKPTTHIGYIPNPWKVENGKYTLKTADEAEKAARTTGEDVTVSLVRDPAEDGGGLLSDGQVNIKQQIVNVNGTDVKTNAGDPNHRIYDFSFTFADPKATTITKTWQGVPESEIPDSLVINAYSDKEKTNLVKSFTLYKDPKKSASGVPWLAYWDDMPEGKDVKDYYWSEEMPNGFTQVAFFAQNKKGKTPSMVYFKNTTGPQIIKARVTKQWVDNDNKDESRPQSVIVSLFRREADNDSSSGELVSGYDQVKLDESNGWKFETKELPRMTDGGTIYEYYWMELEEYNPGIISDDLLLGYVPTTEDSFIPEGENYVYVTNITNSHTSETKSKVAKVWNDKNDYFKTRPSYIEATLYQNGEKYNNFKVKFIDKNGAEEKEETNDGTIFLTENYGWQATAYDLPKFDDKGNEYEYTWKETLIPKYYDNDGNVNYTYNK